MNNTRKTDDGLTSEQIARRRDDAVRRALNTPPRPLKEMKKGKSKKRQDEPATPQTKP